jgi:excisionase family DNA binding protein
VNPRPTGLPSLDDLAADPSKAAGLPPWTVTSALCPGSPCSRWYFDPNKGGPLYMDKLLTVKEAAEVLSCSQAAIRKWLYQRRLPRVKVGRLVRVRAGDLEAMISTHPARP